MRAALDAAGPGDDAALKRALRALRKRVMLNLIARDLGGAGFARRGRWKRRRRSPKSQRATRSRGSRPTSAPGTASPLASPGGRAQQLHVVGMGKLGGAELNVSSDVDLVFAYPEEGETAGPRSISNHEYFTRLGTQAHRRPVRGDRRTATFSAWTCG